MMGKKGVDVVVGKLIVVIGLYWWGTTRSGGDWEDSNGGLGGGGVKETFAICSKLSNGNTCS